MLAVLALMFAFAIIILLQIRANVIEYRTYSLQIQSEQRDTTNGIENILLGVNPNQ